MPPYQVVAHYFIESYDRAFRESLKIAALPPHVAIPLHRELDTLIDDEEWGSMMVSLLWPSTARAQRSFVVVVQRQSASMIIEALRDHAAKHGNLPASLDEMSLFVPKDPMTDTPFVYERVADDRAVLRAAKFDDASDRDIWSWYIDLRAN